VYNAVLNHKNKAGLPTIGPGYHYDPWFPSLPLSSFGGILNY